MPSANTRRAVSVEEPVEAVEDAVEEVEEEAVPDADEPVEEAQEDTEDELTDDDELWEGGPTYGHLKAWKEQYGEDNIFVSLINPDFNQYCVWRTLNRHEYRELMKQMEAAVTSGQVSDSEAAFNNEEALTETCVLYPPYNRHDRVHTNAGFPRIMANDIMEQSGFVPVEVRKI